MFGIHSSLAALTSSLTSALTGLTLVSTSGNRIPRTYGFALLRTYTVYDSDSPFPNEYGLLTDEERLLMAAIRGNLARVKQLLTGSVNVNFRFRGKTLLEILEDTTGSKMADVLEIPPTSILEKSIMLDESFGTIHMKYYINIDKSNYPSIIAHLREKGAGKEL
jgi:hypothetical protein